MLEYMRTQCENIMHPSVCTDHGLQVQQHVPTLSDEETIFPHKRLAALLRRVGQQSLKRIEKMAAKHYNSDVCLAS